MLGIESVDYESHRDIVIS
jgi:hypothetical protein